MDQLSEEIKMISVKEWNELYVAYLANYNKHENRDYGLLVVLAEILLSSQTIADNKADMKVKRANIKAHHEDVNKIINQKRAQAAAKQKAQNGIQ